VLTRDGALDAVTVEVETVPGSGPDATERAAADAAHQIKSRLGVTCTVQVKGPGEVPRSQGKAVRVKDLRLKD
jgi:phenylacetate-CoA ligase